MASFVFEFLVRYQKDGDEFLNDIVSVTDDETWISFVNAQNNEQAKQRMHKHSSNNPKKYKQTNIWCQKADRNFNGTENQY
jgi:hypothetical protein